VTAQRRYPTTIAVLVLLVGVALLTASNTTVEQSDLRRRIGMDLVALRELRFWTMPVATFVQSGPGIEWHMLLLVTLPLLALEYLSGSIPALLAFLLSDWLTAPLTVVVLWALSGMGSSTARAFLHAPDSGSSAAAHGALAAAIVQLPRRYAGVGLALLIGISILAFTFVSLDVAIAHLLGVGVGIAIGVILRRRAAHHLA
jgi:hypothetical protein